MPYCFMSEPDCPAGIRFVLLADVEGLGWGIFEVESSEAWAPEHLVSDVLARLIESAKRFPPAMALARQEMAHVFEGAAPDRHQLARAYGTALEVQLARQHEAPYVLARALRGEASERAEGEWYWVLGISRSIASWVSADYFVHQSPMNDFDLTGQQLKRLGYAG